MNYRAVCRYFELPLRWGQGAEREVVDLLEVDAQGRSDQEVIRDLAARVYDMASDDRGLREVLGRGREAIGARFVEMRVNYPVPTGLPARSGASGFSPPDA